jgi:hypothetical protein
LRAKDETSSSIFVSKRRGKGEMSSVAANHGTKKTSHKTATFVIQPAALKTSRLSALIRQLVTDM